MKSYEYRLATFATNPHGQPYIIAEDEKPIEGVSLLSYLNAAGRDGWQLIPTVIHISFGVAFLLMRETVATDEPVRAEASALDEQGRANSARD